MDAGALFRLMLLLTLVCEIKAVRFIEMIKHFTMNADKKKETVWPVCQLPVSLQAVLMTLLAYS